MKSLHKKIRDKLPAETFEKTKSKVDTFLDVQQELYWKIGGRTPPEPITSIHNWLRRKFNETPEEET